MSRPKRNNLESLQHHRAVYQKNCETIAKLTAENDRLSHVILEEENNEIINTVRCYGVPLENLATVLQGLRNQSEVPVSMFMQPAEPMEEPNLKEEPSYEAQ